MAALRGAVSAAIEPGGRGMGMGGIGGIGSWQHACGTGIEGVGTDGIEKPAGSVGVGNGGNGRHGI